MRDQDHHTAGALRELGTSAASRRLRVVCLSHEEHVPSSLPLSAVATLRNYPPLSPTQTVYLPIPGLVDAADLRPGDLIGTNKESYLILEKLPTEYDPRVKAMELDEKPTEDYGDIGGCDKQIQELIEAVVLPMTHADRFKALGIRPPKGVLLHGPPGMHTRARVTHSWRSCYVSNDRPSSYVNCHRHQLQPSHTQALARRC